VFYQASRQSPSQKLQTLSFSLIEEEASAAALEAACKAHGGKSPDAVFLCAGKSTPGFFIEQDSRSLQSGMNNGYWIQAYSALVRSNTASNLLALFIYPI
jgi:3-dehydrosphinganine reductase